MLRKFRRDHLRKQVGNSNLKDTWKRFQMDKYGVDFIRVCRKGGK